MPYRFRFSFLSLHAASQPFKDFLYQPMIRSFRSEMPLFSSSQLNAAMKSVPVHSQISRWQDVCSIHLFTARALQTFDTLEIIIELMEHTQGSDRLKGLHKQRIACSGLARW